MGWGEGSGDPPSSVKFGRHPAVVSETNMYNGQRRWEEKREEKITSTWVLTKDSFNKTGTRELQLVTNSGLLYHATSGLTFIPKPCTDNNLALESYVSAAQAPKN